MREMSGRRDFLQLAGLSLGGMMLPRIAWAAQADPLAYIDPELRELARMWLRAQTMKPAAPAAAPVVPAARPKMPEGVVERVIPGGRGMPPVTVYIVSPTGAAAPPRGAILHMHGGGFMYGSAMDNLGRLKGLVERIDCVIVTVEYRLAPATRFPGPLEDNYAALKWLSANAAALGADPSRIALMGESAGGGHAAMLAIAARDRGEVTPCFQALVYPMLDDRTGSTRPVPRNIGTIVWTAEDNRKGWAAVLGQRAGLGKVPPGSVPARVETLAGLPPTFIAVGAIDLFVDEDVTYARRLIGAGVATELLVLPGAYHAFDYAAPQARVSRQFQSAFENALARAIAPLK